MSTTTDPAYPPGLSTEPPQRRSTGCMFGTFRAAGRTETSVGVTDPLAYLNAIKTQFKDQLEVQGQFWDILKTFRSGGIDLSTAVHQVSELFKDMPHLVEGCAALLPRGYRVKCARDTRGNEVVSVLPPEPGMKADERPAREKRRRVHAMRARIGPGSQGMLRSEVWTHGRLRADFERLRALTRR